jgi:hypothetical protein
MEHADSTHALKDDEIHVLERSLMGAAGQLGSLARTIEDRIMHLGFKAPELIDGAASDTAVKMRDKNMTSISFQDVTQDLQTLVEVEVNEIIELLQGTALKAVQEVLHVGRALKRSGLPNENEVVSLVRDAPRFEFPPVAGSVELNYWKFLGHRVIRGRLLRALQSTIQPLFRKQLGDYSAALGAWSKATIQDIQFSVESYADGYRSALQEMSQSRDSTSDAAQIQEDIAMLTTTD